jgi:hypothetical protein
MRKSKLAFINCLLGMVRKPETLNPENPEPGIIMLNAGQFFGISYRDFVQIPGIILDPIYIIQLLYFPLKYFS